MPQLYLVRSFFFFFFLGLFCTTRDRDAPVSDHMCIHNDEVHWDLGLICDCVRELKKYF
jgi:hypothetical protein